MSSQTNWRASVVILALALVFGSLPVFAETVSIVCSSTRSLSVQIPDGGSVDHAENSDPGIQSYGFTFEIPPGESGREPVSGTLSLRSFTSMSTQSTIRAFPLNCTHRRGKGTYCEWEDGFFTFSIALDRFVRVSDAEHGEAGFRVPMEIGTCGVGVLRTEPVFSEPWPKPRG